MKKFKLTAKVAKQLDRLPMDAQDRIRAALQLYESSGQGDVKALTGRSGYRLRVGNYRVIFGKDGEISSISHRTTTTYR